MKIKHRLQTEWWGRASLVNYVFLIIAAIGTIDALIKYFTDAKPGFANYVLWFAAFVIITHIIYITIVGRNFRDNKQFINAIDQLNIIAVSAHAPDNTLILDKVCNTTSYFESSKELKEDLSALRERNNDENTITTKEDIQEFYYIRSILQKAVALSGFGNGILITENIDGNEVYRKVKWETIKT